MDGVKRCVSVLVTHCESADALQVPRPQGIPGDSDDQEASDEDLGDEANGGAHVELEE